MFDQRTSAFVFHFTTREKFLVVGFGDEQVRVLQADDERLVTISLYLAPREIWLQDFWWSDDGSGVST